MPDFVSATVRTHNLFQFPIYSNFLSNFLSSDVICAAFYHTGLIPVKMVFTPVRIVMRTLEFLLNKFIIDIMIMFIT